MIIDRIMHSYCGLEEEHYRNGEQMPIGILLSMNAYRELPPRYESSVKDFKICGVPISIADMQDEFRWIFPEKPKQVIEINPKLR